MKIRALCDVDIDDMQVAFYALRLEPHGGELLLHELIGGLLRLPALRTHLGDGTSASSAAVVLVRTLGPAPQLDGSVIVRTTSNRIDSQIPSSWTVGVLQKQRAERPLRPRHRICTAWHCKHEGPYFMWRNV